MATHSVLPVRSAATTSTLPACAQSDALAFSTFCTNRRMNGGILEGVACLHKHCYCTSIVNLEHANYVSARPLYYISTQISAALAEKPIILLLFPLPPDSDLIPPNKYTNPAIDASKANLISHC